MGVEAIRSEVSYILRSPLWDYGNVRGRSMIVAAAASETPTHSTEPIKKGEEQDREVGEKEERVR